MFLDERKTVYVTVLFTFLRITQFKGSDHLTVTWKVADNIYQHIDVLEKNKVNAFSLGQSLWIEKEEFEDLDEIIARYINPMAACARDILNYKYYKDTEGGKYEIAEKYLREEKRKVPNKIHYIFSAWAVSIFYFALRGGWRKLANK